MAKAGFWLNGARGKLAGASLSKRVNGATIMREIVTPKNPKTNGQLYQRMIMATVMKAYASCKEIFDHSHQGYSKGSENQRRFLSNNAKILRSLLAADLASTPMGINARIVAPKVSAPVFFNGLKISEGSYPMTPFIVLNNDSYGFAQPAENETIAQYATRVGLKAGDIYTFIVYHANDNSLFNLAGLGTDAALANVYESSVSIARFIIKEGLESKTDVLTDSSHLSLIADIEIQDNGYNFSPFTFGEAVSVIEKTATGVIRSREDEDLRSTSYIVHKSEDTDASESYGLAALYALSAWKQGTSQVGDSSLILEGGDVDNILTPPVE